MIRLTASQLQASHPWREARFAACPIRRRSWGQAKGWIWWEKGAWLHRGGDGVTSLVRSFGGLDVSITDLIATDWTSSGVELQNPTPPVTDTGTGTGTGGTGSTATAGTKSTPANSALPKTPSSGSPTVGSGAGGGGGGGGGLPMGTGTAVRGGSSGSTYINWPKVQISAYVRTGCVDANAFGGPKMQVAVTVEMPYVKADDPAYGAYMGHVTIGSKTISFMIYPGGPPAVFVEFIAATANSPCTFTATASKPHIWVSTIDNQGNSQNVNPSTSTKSVTVMSPHWCTPGELPSPPINPPGPNPPDNPPSPDNGPGYPYPSDEWGYYTTDQYGNKTYGETWRSNATASYYGGSAGAPAL